MTISPLVRRLVDPLSLPATSAARQLHNAARGAGFETITTTVEETGLVTVQGFHDERGGFMATWIPGHVYGRLYLNTPVAWIVPVSYLKSWVKYGEYWLDV